MSKSDKTVVYAILLYFLSVVFALNARMYWWCALGLLVTFPLTYVNIKLLWLYTFGKDSHDK